MHWTSISKYERNEAEPYLDGLKKLAKALDTSTDFLLFEDFEPQPEISDSKLFDKLLSADKLSDANRNTLKNLIQSFLDFQGK